MTFIVVPRSAVAAAKTIARGGPGRPSMASRLARNATIIGPISCFRPPGRMARTRSSFAGAGYQYRLVHKWLKPLCARFAGRNERDDVVFAAALAVWWSGRRDPAARLPTIPRGCALGAVGVEVGARDVGEFLSRPSCNDATIGPGQSGALPVEEEIWSVRHDASRIGA